MNFRTERRPDPVIDMTPMIDIVFQLVLFFMVSTTFVNAPGIQVDLPRASSQMIVSEKDDMNIWITADGSLFVDNVAVDFKQLTGRLQGTASLDPSTLIVIKADAGVAHGRVVKVMDLARSKGLTRLAIATESNQGTTKTE